MYSKYITLGSAGLIIIALFLIFGIGGGDASFTSSDKAIIVVSDLNGYDDDELGKALSFYDYLIEEGFTTSNIEFLVDDGVPGQDDEGSKSNVESALSSLANDTSIKNIIIYISDNGHAGVNTDYYQFEDGNLSKPYIEAWMDDMTYNELTYISMGNHSGLFGNSLLDDDRVIIASMDPTESVDPDNFNITRSLEDPLNDDNNDNWVSFEEAFYAERDLVGVYQTPMIWKLP